MARRIKSGGHAAEVDSFTVINSLVFLRGVFTVPPLDNADGFMRGQHAVVARPRMVRMAVGDQRLFYGERGVDKRINRLYI